MSLPRLGDGHLRVPPPSGGWSSTNIQLTINFQTIQRFHESCDFPCSLAENIFLSIFRRLDRLNSFGGSGAGAGVGVGNDGGLAIAAMMSSVNEDSPSSVGTSGVLVLSSV